MSSSHNKDITSRVTNVRTGTERAVSAVAAIAVAFLLAVPVASVFGVSDHVQAAPKYVLRIGFMQPVDSLNPFAGFTEGSRFFYGLVYDCLQSAGNDLEPVPNLATSWWIVPESDQALVVSGEPYGSVWQYNLTQDATWHDGVQFTADDVVYTINLNCQNYEATWTYQPYAYFMMYAEKIDQYTVRVHFYEREAGEPMPVAFGDMLSIPILPEHMLANMTAYDIGFSWSGVFPGHDPPLVGTGPYMAESSIYQQWLDGDHITLTRNPDYHQSKEKGLEPLFDKVILSFYDESTAMRLALQNGVIDIAKFPASAFKAMDTGIKNGTLKDMGAYSGLKPNGQFTYISFSLGHVGGLGEGPTNFAIVDPAVRKALTMATNKTHIVEEFYFGYAEEGSTLVSPMRSDWHYEPSESERFEYNLSAAANLLENSGYSDVDSDDIREATSESYAVQEGLVAEWTDLIFTMAVLRDPQEEIDMAKWLGSQWEQIGVNMTYRILNEGAWPISGGGTLCPWDMDMGVWSWTSDLDPNYMLFVQSERAQSGWSDNFYFNPEYEDNYTASVSALDESERQAYVRECQRIHYLDAVYLELVYNYQTYVWRTDTIRADYWGNWSAQPGRSLDNVWGAHPLLLGEYVTTDHGISLPFYVKFLIGAGVIIVVAVEAALIYNKHKKASPPRSSE